MKDSQLWNGIKDIISKYIKANNERFSTIMVLMLSDRISISRRIMKDSQLACSALRNWNKYIKANNERFST